MRAIRLALLLSLTLPCGAETAASWQRIFESVGISPGVAAQIAILEGFGPPAQSVGIRTDGA